MKNIRTALSAVLAVIIMLSTVGGGSVSAKSKVRLNKQSITLKVGGKYTLKLLNCKKKITWKTSNKRVATVSSKGKVTAKKAGSATVSAVVGKKSYKCTVKVKKQLVTKVKLSKKSIVLTKGDIYWLTATVSPKTAGNKKLKWTSSNKKIAAVSSKGRITAVGAGSATVKATATDGSKKSASCKVTVQHTDPKKTFSYVKNVISDYYTGINDEGNPLISNTQEQEITTSDAKTNVVLTSGIVYSIKDESLKFILTAEYPLEYYDVHLVSEIEILYSDIAHSHVSQWAVLKPLDEGDEICSDMHTILTNADYDPSKDVDFDIITNLTEPISDTTRQALQVMTNPLLRANLRGADAILKQCGASLEELGFYSY